MFQYLNRGCTQYFTHASTENKLASAQKSKDHSTKGCLKDTLLDDIEDFNNLDQALSRMGISENGRMEIYSIVAAVLHLGNITFEDNPDDTKGGCRVTDSSEKSMIIVSRLIGIDCSELRQALVSRVMQSSRGGMKGTVIM